MTALSINVILLLGVALTSIQLSTVKGVSEPEPFCEGSGKPLFDHTCSVIRKCPRGYTCKTGSLPGFGTCCPDKCKLPKNNMPCEKTQCWRYHPRTKECRKSNKCCKDHTNNYESYRQCIFSCKPKNDCSAELGDRRCRGRCKGYFFDQETRSCKRVTSGRKNANQFRTKEVCLDFCNDGCDDGITPSRVTCIIAACPHFLSCTNVPDAKCIPRCNNCISKWFVANGTDVTDRCF